jgi:hypothetical protein
MEDNNKQCGKCKRMLSLTCFETNRRTGELFKTCAHCLEHAARYRERHRKDLETKDPTRAGYLSYYILWGNSTSKQKNIQDYKRKFHL